MERSVVAENKEKDCDQKSKDMNTIPKLNESPVSKPITGTPDTPESITQKEMNKNIRNIAFLCSVAQETIQEIVSRVKEVFDFVKTLAPPDGNLDRDRYNAEKKKR